MNFLKSAIVSKTLAAMAFVVAGLFAPSAFAQRSAAVPSNVTPELGYYAQMYSPVGT